MITKQQWDSSITSLRNKIFSLYCEDGVISLENLYDLRSILGEMDAMMQELFKALKFPILYFVRHNVVKKEVLQLENKYKAFEYNLELFSKAA